MSKNIYNPALANITENGANSASFEISPVQGGYANTLGNSLRRVLLSSIKGAAVVAFRVDGANHEFTTLPGVKEDIIDIMQNIKSLRFKVFTDDPVELRIEKKGSGEVTAADIKANSDVEIVDKSQVICTIDDPKASVGIDLIVETGRGYQTIEVSSAKRIHSDTIAVDAIFSPVLRVRYKVDNTRVGQNTDLDKLIVNVDTDGSITPTEAFEEAAAILVNQYTALAGSTTVDFDNAPGTDEEDDQNELNTSIEDLNLTARTANALINNDIHTVHDLVTLKEQDLRELKGFGTKALDEVNEKLAELEL